MNCTTPGCKEEARGGSFGTLCAPCNAHYNDLSRSWLGCMKLIEQGWQIVWNFPADHAFAYQMPNGPEGANGTGVSIGRVTFKALLDRNLIARRGPSRFGVALYRPMHLRGG